MAKGHARALQRPTVSITVFGNVLEALIDTGLDSGLQLPVRWKDDFLPILPKPHPLIFEEGFGAISETDGYIIPISLDNSPMKVEMFFSPTEQVLLGIYALQECRLVIDFPAGTVELTKATP